MDRSLFKAQDFLVGIYLLSDSKMESCVKVLLLLAVVCSARSRHTCNGSCNENETRAVSTSPESAAVDTIQPASSLNIVRDDGTSGDGGYVNQGIGFDRYPFVPNGPNGPFPLDFEGGQAFGGVGGARRTVQRIQFNPGSQIVRPIGGIPMHEQKLAPIKPVFPNNAAGNGNKITGLHTKIEVPLKEDPLKNGKETANGPFSGLFEGGGPFKKLMSGDTFIGKLLKKGVSSDLNQKEKETPKGPLAGMFESGPLKKLLSGDGLIGKLLKKDEPSDKEKKPLAGVLGNPADGGSAGKKGQWGLYLGKILVDALSTFVKGTQKAFSSQFT